MVKTGLLVVTNPTKIGRILPAIPKHVKNTLYVQLSQDNQLRIGGDQLYHSPYTGQTIVRIYSQTSTLCQNIDVRVLLRGIKDPFLPIINTKTEIEVVFFDQNYTKDEMSLFVQTFLPNAKSSCQMMKLSGLLEDPCMKNNLSQRPLIDSVQEMSNESKCLESSKQKIYDYVVLGGTFDRLHAGHKILLTEAVLHCSKKLTVGVTDTVMLKSKKLWELIEPCEKRMSCVEDFLSDVQPNLNYDIVPICDPFGPTKVDRRLQMIVVSAETYKGGIKVNELRKQNGLSALDILTVELLESNFLQFEHEESKISSSNYRMRLLGTRLQTPKMKTKPSDGPYIIGLTGNIASGKSTTAKRLANLGAGLIDCDILAHNLYKKGQPFHSVLVQHFGEGILNGQGEVDRKVLGAVVFKDKDQLDLINSLLWPPILKNAMDEAVQLYQKGHQFVVMEASVLIQAGWDEHCNEVWACIIPPEETVKRLGVRNSLSRHEAESRLALQPSTMEYVSRAHVVICTAWESEFTQYQVEKAWNQLQTLFGNEQR